MGRWGCGIIGFFIVLWMIVVRLNMFFYENVLGFELIPDGALAVFIFTKSTLIIYALFWYLQGVAENYQEMRKRGDL